MKTVVLLSYNNLGLEFWNRHLNFNHNVEVHHFRTGKSCISALAVGLKADVIIVDDYFARTEKGDYSGHEVVNKVSKKFTKIPCFHITPDLAEVANGNGDQHVVFSNFDESVLALINNSLDAQLAETA
jgi:hypothetical protein